MRSVSKIRPSPIAGSWYPSDAKQLAQEVDQYIRQASSEITAGEIKGILVPHAGYRYSGVTAGHAFGRINACEFDLVVILSPYHSYHPGLILSSDHQKYETPLGTVPIDRDLLDRLDQNLKMNQGLKLDSVAYDQEHSLEIELPFLQRSLKSPFFLLPLMVRSVDNVFAKQIAAVIFELIKYRNCLIVISTDLSHFYSQPVAEKLDKTMLDAISSFSSEAVFQTEEAGRGFACGLGAILIGLELTRLMGADKIEILAHSTSGEQTGDWSSVVGYGAAVILNSLEPRK
ncbi:MAG: AmmeMemoRadiSam system protein B [Chloroflexi bacterium 44-23]|nr:MAG: AmmeMemoRadiSam system protein B [Chloroflexi bacterium 44-23]